ncbi:hypothetical protein SAMN02982927_01582 [Sporolactobacillus nakayamae]|uniref:Uncharacterized protein n=1 Tax=Sporolactobacillus nakayamae TaxID=269670 RepID=A0A1I2RI92_9BACL|nr:hypothetical protein SAMN02982927_01582 [Sporolactobacillus nakayamae]
MASLFFCTGKKVQETINLILNRRFGYSLAKGAPRASSGQAGICVLAARDQQRHSRRRPRIPALIPGQDTGLLVGYRAKSYTSLPEIKELRAAMLTSYEQC